MWLNLGLRARFVNIMPTLTQNGVLGLASATETMLFSTFSLLRCWRDVRLKRCAQSRFA